jgi:hypothetical protein
MLVTCRGRALDFQQYFQEAEILDLDEDTDIDELAMGRIRHIGSRQVANESRIFHTGIQKRPPPPSQQRSKIEISWYLKELSKTNDRNFWGN